MAIGAGLVVWKAKASGHAAEPMNRITKEDFELLFAGAADANPMMLKRMGEDPELRKKQIENIRDMLALASEARREGVTKDLNIQREMKYMRAEVYASSYDSEINKDKGPMPPFGFITEDQTKAFYNGDYRPKGFWGSIKNKIGWGMDDPETDFNSFLDTKLTLLKEGNPAMADRQITEDERNQARDFFAKMRIYEIEADAAIAKSYPTPEETEKWQKFGKRADLQLKLQQAQFLARRITKNLNDKVAVTDEEIAKYIADHPEFDPKEKRTKAEEILARAKNGEDFAKLANEFTEDPGNMDKDGKPQGGIYTNVEKGKMVKPFEDAALALEPGQVSPNLVETDFGFHIIKLERKGEGKDASGKPAETYDARHILISTNVADPSNPMGRPQPAKEIVRAKLQEEKEKKVMDEIVANNPIEVPEDFTLPAVSDEQIKKAMEQQQQQQMPMQMPEGPDQPGAPKPADRPKKPEPAKKK